MDVPGRFVVSEAGMQQPVVVGGFDILDVVDEFGHGSSMNGRSLSDAGVTYQTIEFHEEFDSLVKNIVWWPKRPKNYRNSFFCIKKIKPGFWRDLGKMRSRISFTLFFC